MSKIANLTFAPLSEKNWEKFVELFGDRGAYGGCWCMYFRQENKEYRAGTKSGANKETVRGIVDDGKPVGLLAFDGEKPVAWAAFAPRRDFTRFERSRVHKPIDEEPVWSIPCLFIDKEYRKRGVSLLLLQGVIDYAKENGIEILEAYPVVPGEGKIPDSSAYYGLYSTFKKAGFKIVDHTSKNRPMVRYYIK